MPQPSKNDLKKAFKNNTLEAANLGAFIELVLQYRGYYIKNNKPHWAGDWRNDQTAAAMDILPYMQQGFKTGIQVRPS